MESPSAPDRCVDTVQEDSTSVEPASPHSLPDESSARRCVVGGSSTGETNTEEQGSSGGDFLPMKTEIKKMGVEISDEKAEQLKNDIRRLSPEVVSLRERTLGEISLTPDSSFYETGESDNNPTIDKKTEESPASESCDENSSPISDKIDREAVVRLFRVEISASKKSASWWSSSSISDTREERFKSEESVEFDSKVVDGDELVMAIQDQGSSESNGGISDGVGESESTVVVVDGRTEPTKITDLSSKELKSGDIDNVENCKNIATNVNPTTSTTSRSVIQKLADDEEIVFTGSNVSHVQLQSSSSSSASPTTNGLGFVVVYPETSDACNSSENADDPLRDVETETDSDCSSETTSIQTPANPDCIESLQTSDDQLQDTSTDMIIACGRIEPEGPQTFTEDSAESLALAAGSRDEVRSDGSDSGLGGEIPGDPGPTPAPESDSETSFLDRIPDEILSDKDKASVQLDAFVPESGELIAVGSEVQRPDLSATGNEILPARRSPPKSNLKRRLTDCMEGEPNAKRSNSDDSEKKKRNIHFDAVTVYYFPRAQGFTCVPSQGGSTLGMSAAHTHAERFSLTEHAAEQRRIHRARLAQLRSERAANNVVEAASSSEDPSDDTDEEPSDAEELDIDSYYFLLPVPTWQRRALLRAAGVQKIDTVEKDECRDIRASRKHCGCGCKGYCDPESCPCSRAHVKCQVDRAGFPCGCSRDGCANSSGRIEFNPVRVRTHFIHTLMRLELEKKHRDEDCTDLEGQTALRDVRGMPLPIDGNNPASSCINGGGFTTLHYANAPPDGGPCQPEIPGTREDSLDLYAIRDDCYQSCSEDVVDGGAQTQAHHHHQRKLLHPPTEFGNPTFQPFPNNGNSLQSIQQFQHNSYQEYPGYQSLPSTSRGQFHHQFQPVPGNHQGFSHYGGYVPDAMVQTATAGTMSATVGAMSSPTCHQPQTTYDQNFVQEDGAPSQYTNLNSVQPINAVHHQLGKLEPFSELLAGRYSYYGEVEPQSHEAYPTTVTPKNDTENKPLQMQQQHTEINEDNSQNTIEECDEDFGEIIKKSMVETVSA